MSVFVFPSSSDPKFYATFHNHMVQEARDIGLIVPATGICKLRPAYLPGSPDLPVLRFPQIFSELINDAVDGYQYHIEVFDSGRVSGLPSRNGSRACYTIFAFLANGSVRQLKTEYNPVFVLSPSEFIVSNPTWECGFNMMRLALLRTMQSLRDEAASIISHIEQRLMAQSPNRA
ncbi:MAG: hypothetical protein WC477_04595 [Patescibacteria group bacterium]